MKHVDEEHPVELIIRMGDRDPIESLDRELGFAAKRYQQALGVLSD